MQFDVDELSADELEKLARDNYDSSASRNQFPQETGDSKTPTIGKATVSSVADYTMIPPPDEDDTEFANYNGS